MTTDTLLNTIGQVELKKENLLEDGISYYAEWSPDDLAPYQLIVLTDGKGLRVGGILKMGDFDIQVAVIPQSQDEHFLSNFLRTGIMNRLWPDNKTASIITSEISGLDDCLKKVHLLELAGLQLTNSVQIEEIIQEYKEEN